MPPYMQFSTMATIERQRLPIKHVHQFKTVKQKSHCDQLLIRTSTNLTNTVM